MYSNDSLKLTLLTYLFRIAPERIPTFCCANVELEILNVEWAVALIHNLTFKIQHSVGQGW